MSYTLVDELEIPEELPEPSRRLVARIAEIGYSLPPERIARRQQERGQIVRPMLHIDWEPLNVEYDFNPEVFPDNPHNYRQEWYTVYDREGNLLGSYSNFGKVYAAFKELGYPLTKNSVFRPRLVGKIFVVQLVNEPWAETDSQGNPRLDPVTGKPVMRPNYYVLPVEELANYTPPPVRPKLRFGYRNQGGGIARSEPTAEQIEALKRAMNGRSESEYVDAILDSGDPLINTDPFIGEAADGAKLTERLVKYGARVVNGRVFFAS